MALTPRRTAPVFGRYVVMLTGATLVLAAAVETLRPEKDNLPLIAAMFAFTASILALLKSQETHLSVNSRLDDMMREGKAASRAEGRAEGAEAERDRTKKGG